MKRRLTDTVFLVPVELLSRRTHTLVTARCVHTAIFTAPIIDAALVNICYAQMSVCPSKCGFFFNHWLVLRLWTHRHSVWGHRDCNLCDTHTQSFPSSWCRCGHMFSQRNTRQYLQRTKTHIYTHNTIKSNHLCLLISWLAVIITPQQNFTRILGYSS